MKFEIFTDKQRRYRFRIVAANGEILATGEGYESKAGIMQTVRRIKEDFASGSIPIFDENEQQIEIAQVEEAQPEETVTPVTESEPETETWR